MKAATTTCRRTARGSRGARLQVLVASAQVDEVLLGRVEVLVALRYIGVHVNSRLIMLVSLRDLTGTYLGPVVADGVREYLSVVVEGALRERLVQHLRGLEAGARVLVPEREGAVRAHRGQRAVRGVERDVVHCVDVLWTDVRTTRQTSVAPGSGERRATPTYYLPDSRWCWQEAGDT